MGSISNWSYECPFILLLFNYLIILNGPKLHISANGLPLLPITNHAVITIIGSALSSFTSGDFVMRAEEVYEDESQTFPEPAVNISWTLLCRAAKRNTPQTTKDKSPQLWAIKSALLWWVGRKLARLKRLLPLCCVGGYVPAIIHGDVVKWSREEQRQRSDRECRKKSTTNVSSSIKLTFHGDKARESFIFPPILDKRSQPRTLVGKYAHTSIGCVEQW